MPTSAMRILVVGADTLGTGPMLMGLATRGWESRAVGTVREARELLKTFRFDIVLAAEALPDGRGYELTDLIALHQGTLLVGVALSESCLWLPVLQRGDNVFGNRALNADMIESEMEMLLRAPGLASLREITRNNRLRDARPGLHHALPPRRKIAAVASSPIPMASPDKAADRKAGTLTGAEKE